MNEKEKSYEDEKRFSIIIGSGNGCIVTGGV